MKKLISILAVATLISCSTDEPQQTQTDCGCGIITKRTQPSPSILNFVYDFNDNCTGKPDYVVSTKIYNVGQKICKE